MAVALGQSSFMSVDNSSGQKLAGRAFRGDSAVLAVACSPAGPKLLTGCDGKLARVLDVSTREQLIAYRLRSEVNVN